MATFVAGTPPARNTSIDHSIIGSFVPAGPAWEGQVPAVASVQASVREQGDALVFAYRILPGAAAAAMAWRRRAWPGSLKRCCRGRARCWKWSSRPSWLLPSMAVAVRDNGKIQTRVGFLRMTQT